MPKTKLWKLADVAYARISHVMSMPSLGEEIRRKQVERVAVGPSAHGERAAVAATHRNIGNDGSDTDEEAELDNVACALILYVFPFYCCVN